MLITQTSLKKLSYSDHQYDNECDFNPDRISFTCFSGAIDCLTGLSELHCISDLPSEFFYHLSKISHNLHSLNIIIRNGVSKIPNELKELISLQNNLKDLKLSASSEGNWTDIIPALTKHSNTLTKLHLNNDYVDDLPYLSISYGCTKPEYVMKFLENNGKNLKGFYLEEVDCTLNSSIAKLCPNLKKLSISFKNSELDTLRIIFNSCQYLESIKVNCGIYWLKEKEVLETITKYSPKTFCELKICHYSDSELLPEDLESFFINWKNRPSFTLIINKNYGCINLEVENMKIIKKYKNLDIIKKFEAI
ncbi:hypothetical protein C1645_833255 [Glomus cerebriforme]|uniref:F-box domain-containing protein n=1 Tax=Glomus cerebriforme TaxID=658196 RepID=A0A397SGE4_9GLOM|nr:hypothetical protein C1645_833255 [Glomus cerebriforme]